VEGSAVAIRIGIRDGCLRMPWGEAMAAASEIGYDGDLVLETPPTDDPRAAAAHNLRYLRALL
jgi:sugar phosphate isomerase/epimerase